MVALDGLDLDARPGRVVRIVGASGSGKTTALWIMGLMATPSSGRVELLGEDVTAARPARRAGLRKRHVGFVFQAFNLIPYLSAIDNVALACAHEPGPRRRAADALAAVGLADAARALPRELSGGEQQRVAIARAMAKRPALLIADEPTGNLDQPNARAIAAALFEAAAAGLAVVVATHAASLFDAAHDTVRLRDGRPLPQSNAQPPPHGMTVAVAPQHEHGGAHAVGG